MLCTLAGAVRIAHPASDFARDVPACACLCENGAPDGDRLDVLVTPVQAFEAKHCPMPAADPIEAIKFRMGQQGLTPRDLEPMIGRLNRMYEVMARRRPLTMAMARRLHAQLGISAESLIGDPRATVQ